MQVTNTPYYHTDVVKNNTLDSRQNTSEIPETTKDVGADIVSISDTGRNAEEKWQEIADKYDMKNISGHEVLGMAKELYDNKLISGDDYLSMYVPSGIDDNLNDGGNYIDRTAKELASLKEHDDGSIKSRAAIDARSKILDIVMRIG